MSEGSSLATIPGGGPASLVSVGTRELRARVQAIQQAMSEVMKQDVHYGVVPGAKKPSLWKPGAELICTMFGLAAIVKSVVVADEPDRVIRWKGQQYVDGPQGRVKVEVEGETYGLYEIASVCDIVNQSGQVLASCSGSANNVENKYRTLSVWDTRNTLRKMSEKRAIVASVLVATGASDMFSQDLEEQELLPGAIPGANGASSPKSAPGKSAAQPTNGLNDKQNGLAFVKAKQVLGLDGDVLDGFMNWFKGLPKGAKNALDDLCKGGDSANKVLAAYQKASAPKPPASEPTTPPASDTNGSAE